MSSSSIYQRIIRILRRDRPANAPHTTPSAGGSVDGATTPPFTLAWIKNVLIEAWPSAVFIAALVGIIHSHLQWLDAIDGYAYGIVGTVGEIHFLPEKDQAAKNDDDPRVSLFLLDQKAFDQRYLGRTPLDRCELSKDLKAIYKRLQTYNKDVERIPTRPPRTVDLLVVDLDLSPVLYQDLPAVASNEDKLKPDYGQLRRAHEESCQEELDAVLRKNARAIGVASTNIEAIQTILLSPFDASTAKKSDTSGDQSSDTLISQVPNWQNTMKDIVSFGNPDIHVQHGMVFRYACDPGSLAGMAYSASQANSSCAHGCIEYAVDKEQKDKEKEPSHEGSEEPDFRYLPIDPLLYFENIDIVDPDEPDAPLNNKGHRPPRIRTAFFGVSFGSDQFLTPVAKLSGVEVHAGSYLSMLRPVSPFERIALVLDVVSGLIFALLFKFFWAKFFNWRVYGGVTKSACSMIWLIVLALAFLLVSLALVYGSSMLFRYRIWLSPLPVAIGMLFDGMVLAPVHHALESAGNHHHRLSFYNSVKNRFGYEVYMMTKSPNVGFAATLSFGLVVVCWWGVVLYAVLASE